jgi:hypothetical protein
MPHTRIASQKDSDMEQENTTTNKRMARPRRHTRRSQSIATKAERHVIRPAKRAVKSAAEDISERVSSLPEWVPWAAAAVGMGALIYGLFQIKAVRDFVSPVTEPIKGFFGEEDEFGEDVDEFEDEGKGSDYGSNSISAGL